MDQGSSANRTTTSYTGHRLTGLTKAPESETTGWTYDAYGRLTRQTMANGTMTDYGYDGLDRVSSLVHKTSSGAVISGESYVYDAAGNLTSKTVDGVTTSYTYDNIDQLLSESRPGYVCTYTYDGNGNRLTKTLNGVTETYTYDMGDKLLTRSGLSGSFTYAYDGNGRTVSVTKSGFGTTSLSYDFEDRVTGITGPGGLSTSYTYNALDTRTAKSGTGGAKSFKRDGAYVTDPVLSDGVASFVPGLSERTSGVSRFAHGDRMGTTSVLTGASQSVSASMTFDAFGMPLASTGTPSAFGYKGGWGYQEDPETGLKLLGHRYYDAATGRFLTRDPIGDGSNWYAYGAGSSNPNTMADPAGLSSITNPSTAPMMAELAREGVIAGTKRVGFGLGRGFFKDLLRRFLAWVGIGGLASQFVQVTVHRNEKGETSGYTAVYRIGRPEGQYWSQVDPRTDPDYYDHFGMYKEDTPGTQGVQGMVKTSDMGKTWFPRPSQDYDGTPLGNGFWEVYIPSPLTTVQNAVTFPLNPTTFRPPRRIHPSKR